MSLFSVLKSVYQKIRDSEVLRPLGDQPDYLRSISEPVDDIERAYSQYRCQMHQASAMQRTLYRGGSAIMMLLPCKTRPYPAVQAADAVFPFVADTAVKKWWKADRRPVTLAL